MSATAAEPWPSSHREGWATREAHRLTSEIELLVRKLSSMAVAPPPADFADPALELARRCYQARRLRQQMFDGRLFSDPSWDILVDLFIASREERRVSVSSACIAGSCPATTALRHLGRLQDSGLVERVANRTDARSCFVQLSAKGERMMKDYFARLLTAACETPA